MNFSGHEIALLVLLGVFGIASFSVFIMVVVPGSGTKTYGADFDLWNSVVVVVACAWLTGGVTSCGIDDVLGFSFRCSLHAVYLVSDGPVQ